MDYPVFGQTQRMTKTTKIYKSIGVTKAGKLVKFTKSGKAGKTIKSKKIGKAVMSIISKACGKGGKVGKLQKGSKRCAKINGKGGKSGEMRSMAEKDKGRRLKGWHRDGATGRGGASTQPWRAAQWHWVY